MSIDYSKFDQAVRAFFTNDESYPGDPNWDMGEEFQMNILGKLVKEKYSELLPRLRLTTHWKNNTYFDHKTKKLDPDPWFAIAFEDVDYATAPPNPFFLIRFHFDFGRVIKDKKYRNLVVKTVSGTELDKAIEKACRVYAKVYLDNHRKAVKILESSNDSEIAEAITEIQNTTINPSEILGNSPIEITI